MPWRELRLVVEAARAEPVGDRLGAPGASRVQHQFLPREAPAPRQPWDTGPAPPLPARRRLLAWFEDPDEAAIVAALPAEAASPSWTEVPEVDWSTAWREGLGPVEVSEDLVVAPPWDAPPGALIIEPGQGFGTGHHPSTRQALALLVRHAPSHRTALDVGCGSGILALAAARQGLDVWGIDVESSAVSEARRHATVNGLAARFDTTPLDRVGSRFDLVLANLHAELLVRLAPALLARTGRTLIAAGILADREGPVREALGASLACQDRLQDGEWVALRLTRP